MSNKTVDSFFSDLQKRHLKALGFKKQRHVFIRELPDYIEHFQFQGSSWNDTDTPWHFYINVGIQFRDLPRRTPDRDFPFTHTHCRVENLVPNSSPHFEISNENYATLLVVIAKLVQQASSELHHLAFLAYPICKEGHFVYLAG